MTPRTYASPEAFKRALEHLDEAFRRALGHFEHLRCARLG